MVTSVMKTTFPKVEPKVIKYVDNKYLCNDTFGKSQNLKNSCDSTYNDFVFSCKNVLDKIAPWNKTYVPENLLLYMN